MKCFVEENLLTGEEQQQIAAITVPAEKLRSLLQKISTLLKADNTGGFYTMLKVMKEHGGKGTQTLTNHMMDELKLSPGESDSLQCSDEPVNSTHHEGLFDFKYIISA